MKATAKDLRFQTKDVFDALDRGEDVVISYRGKERAKLVSLEKPGLDTMGKQALFGLWRDRTDLKDVKRHVRSLRRDRRQG